MSLPVTRRIARAALLVAAGAAPVVAVAGTANAADQTKAADLGGLTQLDSASETLNGAVKDGGGLLNSVGETAAGELAPAAVKATGPLIGDAAPAAHKAATFAQAEVAKHAKDGSATDAMPTNAPQGLVSVPVQGLLGGIPIGG
ncbi:ATP-binding protein [Streptomyces sp. NPDC048248]|uniref:ATP-binding protein n=1 Tax=Streptomyces sp. NPDC048248 TaxID=3365523 RepID=UPI003721A9A7